jgi:hypothetical protein
VPFPLSPQNAAAPALTTSPPVSTMVVADPNLKLPRTYQWNVALEQSLGRNQSLAVTYIGAEQMRVNPDVSCFVGLGMEAPLWFVLYFNFVRLPKHIGPI